MYVFSGGDGDDDGGGGGNCIKQAWQETEPAEYVYILRDLLQGIAYMFVGLAK